MNTHLSLFSGIGGLDLAAEWAGFKTVGQCEFADYPHDILKKHYPDVPKWRDVRTLTGEDFYAKTGLRTIDVISGGFPCQPFSVAGQQKGKEDSRYLWPEMLRVIRELNPRFVVGENVPGILRIAAADIVSDLEREGFRCAIFDYEAAAIGAHHRRERVFFVADNANRNYRNKRANQSLAAGKGADATGVHSDVSDAESWREQREQRIRQEARRLGSRCRWSIEPGVGRVAYGVSNRLDRLRCLGNAVVPAQAYPIFAAIADILNDEAVAMGRGREGGAG
ncbi:MAG: DNA (cytosine-5-)-methyltransferase [Clostridia bacterium]|nr:DNA (cytosine-5-)-methyltransferase [Clostridia bacterium]